MRYREFAQLQENASQEMQVQKAPSPQAELEEVKRRLRELNRERLERIRIALHRELRRYLSPSDFERDDLVMRLRSLGG